MIGWTKLPNCPVPHCEAFAKLVADGQLAVIVGREPQPDGSLKWHLSISHRSILIGTAGRIPTWEEISEARYRFCPDETNMAMMLPPKRLYINLHPTCMHLHEIPIALAAQDLAAS